VSLLLFAGGFFITRNHQNFPPQKIKPPLLIKNVIFAVQAVTIKKTTNSRNAKING
jgi:hypothetical protein